MDLGQFVGEFILLFNALAIISIIFFQRRDPSNALPWIIVLFLLPVLGFILYLIFGFNYYKKKRFDLKAEADRAFLERSIERQSARLTAERQKDLENANIYELAMLLLKNSQAVISRKNEVRAFTDGEEKFKAFFEAIESAEHHIHMEYYIIRDDELGRRTISLLTKKAREGVRVRLLFDALGMNIPRSGYQGLVDAGGEVHAFYKVLIPVLSLRVNYRNHRKILVVDGKVGFLGGYNIGEEYLGRGPLGYWRDAAVEVRGEGVYGLQLRFALDWYHATKEYLGDTPEYFPPAPEAGEAFMQVVSGGPDTRWNPIKEEYLKLIGSAKHTVYLQTPYFIPDESIIDALRIAALSGLDVRIMFPNKPDHPFVYWASYSYVGELLKAGVRAYTYENGFIHAKTIVADDLAASIGTANWDIRSFRLNFETNAVVYHRGFAETQRQTFLDDLALCKELTAEAYARRSLGIRFKEGISRLFSPVL